MPSGFREEEPGDQEAGKDEEDVHTDETALEKPHAGVPEDDEKHRQGPKSLDVAAV